MTPNGTRPRIPVARPLLGEEEESALLEVIRSGWVAQGPRVAEFERTFADTVGARHGVAVSSCTAALHLALHLLGIGPGDEVVVPSLSFIATANAVRYTGATPVFADVDPTTLALTPATVAPVLGERTRAVLLVHQAGIPADLDAFRAFGDSLGITIVEDAACAAGSTYRGRPVGADADLAAFSFHPRKLITTGEGGMLVTRVGSWADRVRRLREHGMDVSAADRHASTTPVAESYLEVGFNYRMTDLQAAVGIVQAKRLEGIVAERRARAARYREALLPMGLSMAGDPPWGTTNYQSFWVTLPDDHPLDATDLLERLNEAGISGRRGIMAAHLEPAHAETPAAPLPVTERLAARSVVLPLYPSMDDEAQDRVIDVLAGVVARA